MAKIYGARHFRARLGRIKGPEMVRVVGQALYAAGNLIQVRAQHLITAGAVSGKNHVASAPGEPPNADTHDLDRQIETVMVTPLRVSVASNAPHSDYLEFGTSRMAARPFMAPATQMERKATVALVKKAVDSVTRKR
jgi:HK97 gp10 family phage protein